MYLEERIDLVKEILPGQGHRLCPLVSRFDLWKLLSRMLISLDGKAYSELTDTEKILVCSKTVELISL